MNNSMNNFNGYNFNNQTELPQNINNSNTQYPFNTTYFTNPDVRYNLAMMESSTKIMNIVNNYNETQKNIATFKMKIIGKK